MSREHLWPAWARDVLPHLADRWQLVAYTGGYRKTYHPEIQMERQGSIVGATRRVVCKGCNNGWMSALEEDVRPILTPMMRGEKVVISPAFANALTSWLTLKLIVLDQGQVFTEAERRAFWSDRNQIPETLTLSLFHCGEGSWATSLKEYAIGLTRVGADPPPSANVKLLAWGVGHLFVVGVYRRDIKFPLWVPDTSAVIELWPMLTALTWPPAYRLSEAEADSVSRNLERLAYRPGVGYGGRIGGNG